MEDSTQNLVCKICECQISTLIFKDHIKACKDLAELKEQVLHYQSKLSSHVTKAYDLRNQLNTNFAIEKKKHERRNSINTNRSPSPTADKIIQSVHAQKHFLFDEEIRTNEPMSASQKIGPSKPFLTVNTGLGKKLQEYEDELCKTTNALKAITQYGHSSLSDPTEVNIDLITDLRVRNDVNLMYLEIKDKQISEYIEKFIKVIQKLIKYKQSYIKKLEAQKLTCRTLDTLQIPAINIQPMSSGRTNRLLSLDDGDISDMSSERKKRKSVCSGSSTIWLRRASVGNPGLESKLVFGTPREEKREEDEAKKVQIGLSKFASPMLKKNLSTGSPGSGVAVNKFERGIVIKGKIPMDLKMSMLDISQYSFRFEDRLKKIQEIHERRRHDNYDRSPSPVSGRRKLQIKRNVTIYMDKLERKTPKRQSDMPSTWGDHNRVSGNNSPMAKTRKKTQKIWSMDDVQKRRTQEVKVAQTVKVILTKEEDEEKLSKGDLSPSDSNSDSGSSNSNSMASISEKDDHHEDHEHTEEFPVMTARGYYSDSEITEMKNPVEQSQRKFEVTVQDFQFIKFIGEGAYGKIYLVKKKKTGDIYAMKIIDYADKEASNNKIVSLRAERDAYKSIKGDWVVKAFYTLSYQSYVCFVLEYMIGGDLEGLLEQVGCFEEGSARFYFAELVLAVESLHKLGIVHRDLKPDNVLIDATGHIKLTDFGLSEHGLAKLRNQSSTFQSILSRGNSLIDSNAMSGFQQKISECLNSQKGEAGSQEINSGMDQLMNSSISIQLPDSYSLKKEASQISERFSPDADEPYIIKNKKDEEVVFSCLVAEEKRHSWINKKRLGASDLSANSNSKRKEVHRIVGTPDYIAPEIIKGEDCNSPAVDLWSLGVILYELLAGVPPFNDDGIEKIFANIIQGKMEWPTIGYEEDCMTPEAQDLIKQLMNPDPKQRITIQLLKGHPFFKGFDWKNVKEMRAPYIPNKKNIDPNTVMDMDTIFKLANSKLTKQTSIMNEMTTFNTKRIDLLYQLNQNLYNDHLKDVQKNSKEI